MTQKEKLEYYINKINSNETLKDEIYDQCTMSFYPAEELEEELSWLMEGGCKEGYELVPFSDDGSGGVYVLVNDEHVGYIDSEGGAGYLAETVEDFFNIVLLFRFIYYSKTAMESYEKYRKAYESDSYFEDIRPSELIDNFMKEERMEFNPEKVYKKLLKGMTILPDLFITPEDEEYETSENLLNMEEDEFRDFCEKWNSGTEVK